jgi:hypothetical protein
MPIGRPVPPKAVRQKRTPHSRITLRARHIIRTLQRAKHSSVQRVAVNELTHEVDRRYTAKRAPAMDVGSTGFWVKLSPRARHALRRLRAARNWKVQRQLVNEVRHEVHRSERRAELRLRIQQAARRRAAVAWAKARAAGKWSRKVARSVRIWTGARGRALARICRAEARRASAAKAAKRAPRTSPPARTGRPVPAARSKALAGERPTPAVPAARPRTSRPARPAAVVIPVAPGTPAAPAAPRPARKRTTPAGTR